MDVAFVVKELEKDATEAPTTPCGRDNDSQMEDIGSATEDEREGDRLSDCPAAPATVAEPRQSSDSQEEESAAIPPCGVDGRGDDLSSNASESPI